MTYLYLFYGLFAGYMAGFLGIGCGVFLMPFFLMLDIPYKEAVNASLLSLFFSSLVSSTQHTKVLMTLREPFLVIGITVAIVAVISSSLLIHVTSPVILTIAFAALMFLNADFSVHTLRLKQIEKKLEDINHLDYFSLYVVIGILVGLGAGLLGIGGGIIIIPLLTYVAHFPVKDTVKLAIIIMVLSSFFGLVGGIIYDNVPWSIGLITSVGTVVGGFFGSISLNFIRKSLIVKFNTVISIIVGVIMILRAITY